MKAKKGVATRKNKAALNVHAKVKPVVVKHILNQNYIQQPEVFQNRPIKQMSAQKSNGAMSQMNGNSGYLHNMFGAQDQQ